jgi:hypothetical protein
LWEAPGRGAKPKWREEDFQYLTDCLEKEERTYNSQQLARLLFQERAVDLSGDRIRKLLKKKVIAGNERERVRQESETPRE